MTDATDPFPSLEAIRAALLSAPGPDPEAAAAAAARNAALTKPAGALGRLEEIALWYGGWRGAARPADPIAATLVFAGAHGVAERGVSAYPSSVNAQMVANFEAGGAAINQLSRLHGAAFRVFPLRLEQPTADFTKEAAMDAAAFLEAFGVGAAAARESGAHCLILGEMGIGNTASAAAVCLALHGGGAADWTGPGTGVEGAALTVKRDVVAAGAGRHRAEIEAAGALRGLEALRRLGGREMAALAGAILGARLERIPVLLDGFVVGAAAAAMAAVSPGALDHCLAAHVSAEPGHRRLLEKLGVSPLLDLGMRLGEGSGAAVALGVLRAAIACQSGMASFEEAAVSGALAGGSSGEVSGGSSPEKGRER